MLLLGISWVFGIFFFFFGGGGIRIKVRVRLGLGLDRLPNTKFCMLVEEG